MFVGIANTPRDYAWGSTTAMAELMDWPVTGVPQAELWLGAHPASPSRILDPARVGGALDLAQWIDGDPATALGGELDRLPFLLKILAAQSPLSLQAHPTKTQAREGFARESALGIPLDAPTRNYKDENHKPEMIVAVSSGFRALCGFRPIKEVKEVIRHVPDRSGAGFLDRLDRTGLAETFRWLISGGEEVEELVEVLSKQAMKESSGLDTARSLANEYPGDPGIAISLLLHEVTLAKGEALFLPAGNIHSYLYGLGVELMAASDNVLRGGLTPKHVAVAELTSVVDLTPGPIPYIRPVRSGANADVYRPPVRDFALSVVTGAASIPTGGPAIALCIEGEFSLSGAKTSAGLQRGETAYITPDERVVEVVGSGELFVATVG